MLNGDNKLACWTWQQKFIEWETKISGQANFTGIAGNLSLAQLPTAGVSGTIHLAKLTGGGTDGSITVQNGLITAFIDPT